jgi:hypothetical protein
MGRKFTHSGHPGCHPKASTLSIVDDNLNKMLQLHFLFVSWKRVEKETKVCCGKRKGSMITTNKSFSLFDCV